MLFEMGCGVSKMDHTELVSFCRERKELIKATVDCRYALASAHILYFQSLLDVSDALNGFIEEELVVSVDLPLGVNTDHPLSGEDSHLEFSSMESDTDASSLTDYIHEGLEVSELSSIENDSPPGVSSNVHYMKKFSTLVPTSVFEQPQVVPLTAQWHDSSNPQYGNKASFNGPMNFPSNSVRFSHRENEASSGGPMNFSPNNLRFSQYENVLPSGGLMNLPSNNPRFAQYENGVPFGDKMNFPPNNFRFPHYGNVMFYGGPTNLPLNNLVFDRYGNKVSYDSSAAPPSPASPEVSTWDYLNPFNLVDDIFPSYYFQGRYVSGFSNSDSDLRELREQEGIPDLEDDTKRSPTKAPNEIESEVNDREDLDEGTSEEVLLRNSEKVILSQENKTRAIPTKAPNEIESEVNDRADLDEGTSKEVPLRNGEKVLLSQENKTKGSDDGPEQQENEIKRGPDMIEKYSRTNSDSIFSNSLVEKERKNGEIFEVKEALKNEGESLRPVNSTTLASHGSRDFLETLKEIRDAFGTAFNYGKEVSIMLEAGKLPYQPGGTIFKVFSAWIWSLMAPSMVTYSIPTHMMSKRSASRVMRIAKAINENLEKDICMNSCKLSSTLDKLYIWEKKLYEEVKDEERFRLIYTKKCKKLKALDDRGAEMSKIDATYTSIKRLLPKFNVAVSTIDVISRRTHKIRDEELLPQLNELIHGLIGMWKFMVEFYQKQIQAFMEAKTHVQMANKDVQRNSGLKATKKLETEILNWSASFIDWINSQKSFVKFMNMWLMKCLLQEPEETPDGIAPFSPSRLGAPTIFIICNDWYHAIEKISETGVSKAIHDCASMLHHFWEKLNDEKNQSLKAEYLSMYLEKRLKSLCEESGMNWEQCASSNNAAASASTAERGVPLLEGLYEELKSLRERSNEEKVRHQEAIKKVNDAASHIISGGLVPIFEALQSFSLEMLKAYEQIRIPNGGGSRE